MLRTKLPAADDQLARLRIQAMQVKRLQAQGAQTNSDGNSLSKVEQAAVARGLRQNITSMEPDSNNGVRLSLEQVDFNSALSFLEGLQKQTGLRADTVVIDTVEDSPGVVNARLVLKGVQN